MAKVKKIEPFEQGWEASARKALADSNPYANGTAAHQEWLDGWAAGEEDWKDVCAAEVAAGRPHPEHLNDAGSAS